MKKLRLQKVTTGWSLESACTQQDPNLGDTERLFLKVSLNFFL